MKIRIRSIAIQFAVCAALAAAAACGGDKATGDDDAQDEKTNDSGLGEGAHFTDAGKQQMGPVTCGSQTCKGEGDQKPCCYDAKTDFCGVISSAAQCMALPDPRCPTIATDGGELASCCTADGDCGIDLVWVGRGCTALSDDLFRQLTPNAPKPKRCDANE